MIKMSKNKITSILESSFENGTPFIDYTEDYIYCLIPQGDGNWKEISYDFPSKELDDRIITSTIALRMIVEEVEKGNTNWQKNTGSRRSHSRGADAFLQIRTLASGFVFLLNQERKS